MIYRACGKNVMEYTCLLAIYKKKILLLYMVASYVRYLKSNMVAQTSNPKTNHKTLFWPV